MDRYDGFREFVRARGPAMSRTAFLLTGDHYRASELLQSALAKAAAHWPRVLATGNPDGFVCKAMVTERTPWWRRSARIEHSVMSLPAHEPPDQATSTDGLDAPADRIALAAALSNLNRKQRTVLVLRYYEDMSESEVAQMLGWSAGTVRRHTEDALAQLRTFAPQLAPSSTEVTQ